VGVTALEHTAELDSRCNGDVAMGEAMTLSASSTGLLLAERVARVAIGATFEWRVFLVLLTGVKARPSLSASSSALRPRMQLSTATKEPVTF
jgi:hypothetical protein